MAENNLRVNILANIKNFDAAMTKASSRLNSFGKKTAEVGKSLSLGLTAPITIAGTVAVNQAVRFEKLRTTLNVLTGSADNGAKAFERLVQFSAKTPFQLPDLVAVNNTLMGFGLSAKEAFVNLQRLGDIAGITGGDLNNIAIAFGQAAAEGRLMTRDLRQFINNGVPVIKILAEEMGVAEGEIMDLASQGQITFDVLENAFKNATEAGGTFAGGTKVLSQTLGGLLSTLKDNVNIALAEFGQAIAKAFNLSENIPKISAFLKELTDRFKELSPATQKTIILFTAAVAAIGPLLIIIGKLSIGIGALVTILPKAKLAFVDLTTAMKANPFILVATAIIGVVIALQKLKKQTDAQKLDAFGEDLKKLSLDDAQSKLDKLNKTYEANNKILEENNKLGFGTRKFLLKDADGIQLKANKIDKENIERGEQIKLLKDFIKLKKEEKTISEPTPAFDGTGGGTSTRGQVVSVNQITSQDVVPVAGNPLLQLQANIADSINKIRKSKDDLKLILTDVSGNVQSALSSVVVGLASGSMKMSDVAGLLLGTIGDIATNLGKAAIKIGLTMKAIKLSFSNPFTAIAAGIALLAVGGMIKKAASTVMGGGGGVTGFAKGGLVTGPTLGLVGEGIGTNRGNPEVIAPLDKLQNMIQPKSQRVEVGGQFSINGQDLVLVLQRANSDRSRLL